MYWHYRIRKRIINKQPWFDVVEFTVMGNSRDWTKEGMAPGGESREEVIRCLELMLADAKKYRVLVDKENP